MIISTIQNIGSIPMMKENGIDAVIVSFENVSLRSQHMQPVSMLGQWKEQCAAHGMKLYINMLKLFMEEEMPLLDQFMETLRRIEPDGIYYADEGVYEAAEKYGLCGKLVYQPETLVTSTPDVRFYFDLGVQSVSLAHELSLDEILCIAKSEPAIEVLIHGYFSILYSRRPLVTNYLHHIGKEKEKNAFSIVEQTRKEPMSIIEDETGTHVFSAVPINSYAQIRRLYEAGIRRFRIDNLFLDDEEAAALAKTYKGILDQKIDGSSIKEENSSARWYSQQTVKRKENV